MLTNLNPLIEYALENKTAVLSVNIFSYEDALAVIQASEEMNQPVVLAVSKDMAEYMPLNILGAMLTKMAQESSVDVCVHLDHCYDISIIQQAIDCGFSSVMFDGSQHPLQENIDLTSQVVGLAKGKGVTVEGEIGSVPYTEGRDHIKHELTSPDEAQSFFEKSGVDVMAVSVGNIHRVNGQKIRPNFDLLSQIEQVVLVSQESLVSH